MRMIFPMLRGLGVGEGDEEKIKKMINCSLRLKGKLRNLKGKDSRGSLFSMILVSEIIRMLKLAMRTNSSSSIELESTSNNRRLNAKKMKSPPKMITEKRLVREDLMDLLKALTRKISGENPTLMKEEEFKPQISSHVNLTIEFTEESDLLKIVNFLEKLETFLNNLVEGRIPKIQENGFHVNVPKIQGKPIGEIGGIPKGRVHDGYPIFDRGEGMFKSVKKNDRKIVDSRFNPPTHKKGNPKNVLKISNRGVINPSKNVGKDLGKDLKLIQQKLEKLLNHWKDGFRMEVENLRRKGKSISLKTGGEPSILWKKRENGFKIARMDYRDHAHMRKDPIELIEHIKNIRDHGKMDEIKMTDDSLRSTEKSRRTDMKHVKSDVIEHENLRRSILEIHTVEDSSPYSEKIHLRLKDRIMNEIEKTIESMEVKGEIRNSVKKIRLKLHPPELGKLEISVVKEGRKIEIRFKVQTETVEKIIKQNVENLERKIKDLGFTLNRMIVERFDDFEIKAHHNGDNGDDERNDHSDGNSWNQGGGGERGRKQSKRDFFELLMGSDGDDEWG